MAVRLFRVYLDGAVEGVGNLDLIGGSGEGGKCGDQDWVVETLN